MTAAKLVTSLHCTFFTVEFYKKGDLVDHGDVCIINTLPSCVVMNVSSGSKVRNLVGYAIKQLEVSTLWSAHYVGYGKITYIYA